jgi:hypothetical protein
MADVVDFVEINEVPDDWSGTGQRPATTTLKMKGFIDSEFYTINDWIELTAWLLVAIFVVILIVLIRERRRLI